MKNKFECELSLVIPLIGARVIEVGVVLRHAILLIDFKIRILDNRVTSDESGEF